MPYFSLHDIQSFPISMQLCIAKLSSVLTWVYDLRVSTSSIELKQTPSIYLLRRQHALNWIGCKFYLLVLDRYYEVFGQRITSTLYAICYYQRYLCISMASQIPVIFYYQICLKGYCSSSSSLILQFSIIAKVRYICISPQEPIPDVVILQDIMQHKLVFIETPDVVETTLALDNYRKACDCGRGAVFFSVARLVHLILCFDIYPR